MSPKQSLLLKLVFCNLFIFSSASAAEEFYIEELDTEYRSSLSVQKVFQVDGLKGVTILTGADVRLMKSPQECHQFPLFGSEDTAISIIASSQRLNELEISFEHGYFRVEGRHDSTDTSLQIRIYVDDLESIEMGLNESQTLTISLDQNSQTRIGYITAQDVTIDMQGHGSLLVEELRSESLHISLDGHGKLTFPQVVTATMDVTLNGHGEIDLVGSVYTQMVSLSGHGSYNAVNLDSTHAALYVRGHARSSLRVSDDLSLNVKNLDNVRYQGNPLITRTAEELLLSAL